MVFAISVSCTFFGLVLVLFVMFLAKLMNKKMCPAKKHRVSSDTISDDEGRTLVAPDKAWKYKQVEDDLENQMQGHDVQSQMYAQLKSDNQELISKIGKQQDQLEELNLQLQSQQKVSKENQELVYQIQGLERQLQELMTTQTMTTQLQEKMEASPTQVQAPQEQADNSELTRKVEELTLAESVSRFKLEEKLSQWNEERENLKEQADAAQEAAKVILKKAAALGKKEEPTAESLLLAQQSEIQNLFLEVTQLRKSQSTVKGLQTKLDDVARMNEILVLENSQLRLDLEACRERVKKLSVERALNVASNDGAYSRSRSREGSITKLIFPETECSPPSAAPAHLSNLRHRSKSGTNFSLGPEKGDPLSGKLGERERPAKLFPSKSVQPSRQRQLQGLMDSPERSPSIKVNKSLAPNRTANLPPRAEKAYEQIVVLEKGSWQVRCEVMSSSGSLLQAVCFPAALVQQNRPQSPENDLPSSKQLDVVGAHAWRCAPGSLSHVYGSGLDLIFPMDPNCEIMNKDHISKLWKHAFDALEVAPHGSHVVLSHKPVDDQKQIATMLEILFGSLHVQAVCLVNEAVAIALSTPTATALIVDIGEFSTCITPVHNNNVVETAMCRLEVGGRHLTRFMLQMLQNQKNDVFNQLDPQVQLDIARIFKETHCFVAKDFECLSETEEASSSSAFVQSLQSGKEINIFAGKELFTCPEILFQPHVFSESEHSSGLAEVIMESISACKDTETQKILKQNILLTGGTSQLPGLYQRIKDEIVHLTGENNVQVTALAKVKKESKMNQTEADVSNKHMSSVLQGISCILGEKCSKHWIYSDTFLNSS